MLAFAEPDTQTDEALREQVRELFSRVGTVVDVPERLMSVAGACSGVGPAYWALLVEAQVDAAVAAGMPAALAATLVTETMAGAAELLRDRDTLAVRREVASPGGGTARGLAALEAGQPVEDVEKGLLPDENRPRDVDQRQRRQRRQTRCRRRSASRRAARGGTAQRD